MIISAIINALTSDKESTSSPASSQTPDIAVPGIQTLQTSSDEPEYTAPQQLCNMVLDGFLGRILTWLPLILVSVLADIHEAVAIWVAFSLTVALAPIEYYRSTYRPEYPGFYYFTWVPAIAYLAMGITYTIKPFSSNLISPIATSAYMFTVLLSLVICKPFTEQFVRPQMPEFLTKLPSYHKMNMAMTAMWLGVFGIMVTTSWLSVGLHMSRGSVGRIMLNMVLPYGLLVAFLCFQSKIGSYLMDKYSKDDPKEQTEEGDIV